MKSLDSTNNLGGCLKLICALLLFVSFNIASAQIINIDSFYLVVNKEPDLESKRKHFHRLRQEYLYKHKIQPSEWLAEIKNIFEDERFTSTEYRLIAGNLIGSAYAYVDDHENAYRVELSSARLYESSGLGTPYNIALHYDDAGSSLTALGRLDSALYYLLKAEEISIENDMNTWEINIHKAELFKGLQNWEQFDQAWMDGYNALKKKKLKQERGYFLYMACSDYFGTKHNPERLAFFFQKLDEYQAGKPLSTPKSHYPLLDFLYAPPIDTTIDRLVKALAFNKSINNLRGTNILSRTLANAYSKKENYVLAIGVINNQIQLQKDSIYAIDGYLLNQDLHQYYYAVGNSDMAYSALFKSTEFKDKYVEQRVKDATAEAEVKYETERKEKEFAQQQVLLVQSNQQRNLLIIGGLGLLITAGLLYRLANTRRKNNNVLVEKNAIISTANQEKDNLLKEIHHRVKNNLQIVSSLLSLQSNSTQSKDAKAAIDDGRNRVQSMALIHQNLFIDKERVHVNTKDYIPKLVNHIYDSYAPIAKGIEVEVNVDSIEMDVDTVVPIGLIINELITNAMKYAFVDRDHGTLKVGLSENSNTYEIEVVDNGIGIEQSRTTTIRSGIGSQLIRSFCDKLEAEYKVDSSNGTKVNISIPKAK